MNDVIQSSSDQKTLRPSEKAGGTKLFLNMTRTFLFGSYDIQLNCEIQQGAGGGVGTRGRSLHIRCHQIKL